MNNILIEPTDKTPLIDFNHVTGEMILSGRSIPENAAKIYEPLLNWTLEYVNNAKTNTNLRLNFEYFNTSTSLWITKIIKALCSIKNQESILLIHYYFNIEDFESMDDIKDDIIQMTSNVTVNASLSVGYKIYGTDDEGKVIKESMVYI